MVTAIVLAAGMSARMGKQNKLLLPFAGKTVVETVVQNLVNADIGQIIVITGYEAEMVKRVLTHLPVQIIENSHYAKGMTTSIKAGVAAASGEGYMICLSDMPLITAKEYSFLADIFNKQRLVNSNCICIPKFKDSKGNPVIFSSSYKRLILEHEKMEGCKEIIQLNKENIYWVDISANTLRDMDTAGEYESIKNLIKDKREN
jgi:molybdenum cofactor cytidylyltransferase